eukprot:m.427693 g.427693  ORF g.427693 m.427693 type:complete len:295 (-) comp21363_c1_seq19:850-1734(-)
MISGLGSGRWWTGWRCRISWTPSTHWTGLFTHLISLRAVRAHKYASASLTIDDTLSAAVKHVVLEEAEQVILTAEKHLAKIARKYPVPFKQIRSKTSALRLIAFQLQQIDRDGSAFSAITKHKLRDHLLFKQHQLTLDRKRFDGSELRSAEASVAISARGSYVGPDATPDRATSGYLDVGASCDDDHVSVAMDRDTSKSPDTKGVTQTSTTASLTSAVSGDTPTNVPGANALSITSHDSPDTVTAAHGASNTEQSAVEDLSTRMDDTSHDMETKDIPLRSTAPDIDRPQEYLML